jgi:hypothetical protein
MARPVAHISSRPISLDDLARKLGISKARQKELAALARKGFEQILAERKRAEGNGSKRGKKIANAAAAD